MAFDQLTFPAVPTVRAPGGAPYRFAKAWLEPLFSGVLLLVLVPVLAVIAAAVKASDGGAVLFRQTRIGKDGRPFTMLKFRTLRPHADPYCRKAVNESQGLVTRAGRLLRDRCLDELPQLLSVLKGDMQLIGPRPEMPFIVDQYSDRERARLQVKPGVTGLWQVCAPKDEPIHANLDFDLYYIQNQGFALDLWIIKETLKILVGLRDR